jgi:hypothetical protein
MMDELEEVKTKAKAQGLDLSEDQGHGPRVGPLLNALTGSRGGGPGHMWVAFNPGVGFSDRPGSRTAPLVRRHRAGQVEGKTHRAPTTLVLGTAACRRGAQHSLRLLCAGRGCCFCFVSAGAPWADGASNGAVGTNHIMARRSSSTRRLARPRQSAFALVQARPPCGCSRVRG